MQKSPSRKNARDVQETVFRSMLSIYGPFKVYFLFQRKKKNWKCSLVIKIKQKKHYKIVFSENNSYPNSPV